MSHCQLHSDMLFKVSGPFRVTLPPHIVQYTRIAQEVLINQFWSSHTNPNIGGTISHTRILQTMLLPLTHYILSTQDYSQPVKLIESGKQNNSPVCYALLEDSEILGQQRGTVKSGTVLGLRVAKIVRQLCFPFSLDTRGGFIGTDL